MLYVSFAGGAPHEVHGAKGNQRTNVTQQEGRSSTQICIFPSLLIFPKQQKKKIKMKLSIAALCLGSAAAFSASSFSGTALKASANDAAVTMETGMGINGFGRIGRLGKLKLSQ